MINFSEWEFIQRLASYIEELSPILWEISLRQVWVEVTVKSIQSVVSFIVFGLVFWVARFSIEKVKEDGPEAGGWLTLVVLCVIGGTVLFVIGLDMGITALRYAMNPEYQAIQEILKLMK